jgi:hypothetical protein
LQKWLNGLKSKSPPEPEVSKQEAAQGDSMDEQDYVLSELLIALMRKGVLSDDEGKKLLRKLYR